MVLDVAREQEKRVALLNTIAERLGERYDAPAGLSEKIFEIFISTTPPEKELTLVWNNPFSTNRIYGYICDLGSFLPLLQRERARASERLRRKARKANRRLATSCAARCRE